MADKKYDAIVIGAGPAGYEAALKLSKGGLRTLLIDKEKQKVGGTCLNVGCIPTKTYLQSAELMLKTSWYKELGIDMEIKKFDFEKLKKRTTLLIDEIRSGVLWLLDQAGVEMLYGEASFIDNNTIKVNDTTVTFDKCVIAAGSTIKEYPDLPFDGRYILNSDDIFKLEKLPESITILGGGAIGCEFATFFNAMGVEVNIITRGEHLVPKEDTDVSKVLMREFKKRGVNIITSAQIGGYSIQKGKIVLDIQGVEQKQIESDHLLLAIGREPNTKKLGLENSGVELDEKGFVKVDKTFKTSQDNIYAVGDCIDTIALAHGAYSEAKMAAENILNNTNKENNNVIPSVVYTVPQIARCGITQKEAEQKGINIEIKKNYYKANAKAKIAGDDSGIIKIILDPDSSTILGGTIVGIEASELINILARAVDEKTSLEEFQNSIYPHPSVSEVFSSV